MALLETQIVQTRNDPVTINNLNNEMSSFGWSVLSVQVTHNQNTKTYTKTLDMMFGTGVDTVETTTIEYATITYQRDRKMENYEELAELERQYCELRSELETRLAEVDLEEQEARSYAFKPNFSLSPKKHREFGKKQFAAQMNFIKAVITGKDSYSEKSIEAKNQIALQYRPNFDQIRRKAEALL